jgi:hypothetical protein
MTTALQRRVSQLEDLAAERAPVSSIQLEGLSYEELVKLPPDELELVYREALHRPLLRPGERRAVELEYQRLCKLPLDELKRLQIETLGPPLATMEAS